jgi:MFS family permease
MAASETARLLRRPGFARYFAVVASARATGTMFTVAGVLLVLERTHDLTLGALLVASATLPAALSGPFLGGWLDVTASRRRLLVLDRIVTAAALGALLLLVGHSPDWVVPLIGVLYGVTAPLSGGGFAAVLPEIAGPELLGIANTIEATSINAAFIVGPALSGVIAGTAGPAVAIEVQLVAGLVLAALIAADQTFELRPQRGEAAPEGVLQAVRQGLAATWRIVPLRWNTAIDIVYVLAWSTLYVSLPAFGVSLGEGAHASGYMWAAVAAGSMVGGFALQRRATQPAPGLYIGAYFLAMAATAALWPLAGSLAVALVLIFVTGVLDGPGLVGLISIRQRLAPPHLRAQIFTTANSVHSAVIAAGAAGAGLFERAFGTDATLLTFSALIAFSGAIALIGRSAEDPPTPTAVRGE